MSEIVLADPIVEHAPEQDRHTITRSATFSDGGGIRNGVDDDGAVPFDSERLPPTLARGIQRFLRVANMIQKTEPRVAYLCRFRAFEIAHNMDRNSKGRQVRQFKTALLQRLEHDNNTTLSRRGQRSDTREIKRVYRAYKDYIFSSGGFDRGDRESITNAGTIASVLYEVVKTMPGAIGPQVPVEKESIGAESKFPNLYNILPLDQGGTQQAIMQLPEVKAAVAAVRNTRCLPALQGFEMHMDLLEFLRCCFGFQEGNLANQREHLILLLANTHIRQWNKQTSASKLRDGAVDELMRKFFKNYTDWCKFLGRESNIRLPVVKRKDQQYKILYIGLYLLIWGEAANLRLMPECLCYIFHHMAYELHDVLTGEINFVTGEKVMPAYGGEPESFLRNVVTPIYRVIHEEAKKSKGGTAEHSTWRNYDDLNEYFWSPNCFQIGWPMCLEHDFFYFQSSSEHKAKKAAEENRKREAKKEDLEEHIEIDKDEELRATVEGHHEPKWLGKTNFVEIHSLWQIFRSFDRMWSFFILSLQAMIIMACHDLGSPLEIIDSVIFEDIMSIFITSAILNLIQAILDIAFTWKARLTTDVLEKWKQALKLVVAAIWTIVLPVYYAKTSRKYTCYPTQYGSWHGQLCFSSYMIAAAIYLMTNAVGIVLFFVPVARKYIETSNSKIFKVLAWWTEPRLYIGRGMQETQVSVLKYTLFWILVLLSKFLFSYSFELKAMLVRLWLYGLQL